MEILKEISKDRLIIMVTHNPDLAENYSTRIVRLLDGRLLADSAPLTEEEIRKERSARQGKGGKEEKDEETLLSVLYFLWPLPEKPVH